MDVSIIIPVYNREKLIRSCLNSLIGLKDNVTKEIIIVNDGSSDGTKKIIESEYLQDYPFITLINKENCGVSAARNTGMCHAKGKYLIFVDSDDVISDDYVDKLVSAVVGHELGICSYSIDFIDKNLQIKSRIEKNVNSKELPSVLGEQVLSVNKKGMLNVVWNKIFIRELIEENQLKFLSNLEGAEDIYFILEYLKYVNTIGYEDKILYHYIKHEDGSFLTRYMENLQFIYHSVYVKTKETFEDVLGIDESRVNYVLDGYYLFSNKVILYNSFKKEDNKVEQMKVIHGLKTDNRFVSLLNKQENSDKLDIILRQALKLPSEKMIRLLYRVLFGAKNLMKR